VRKERFFLYYDKLRFTIIHIPLKEVVKTGRTAGNEDVYESSLVGKNGEL